MLRANYRFFTLLIALSLGVCILQLSLHTSVSTKTPRLPRHHHTQALLQQTSLDDSPPYNSFEKLWVFRLYEVILGSLIGSILIVLSIFLIFATEGFAVQIHMVFGIAKKICVTDVSDSHVNKNLDGRVIHLIGETKVRENNGESESDDDDSDFDLFGKDTSSSDDDFDLFGTDPPSASTARETKVTNVPSAKVEAPEVKCLMEAKDPDLNFTPREKVVVLRRIVEMLQWKEDQDVFRSDTQKAKLEWSESIIDCREVQFQNASLPIKSQSFYSSTYLGAYKLSVKQMEKLQQWHPCSLEGFDLSGIENVSRTLRFVGVKDGPKSAGEDHSSETVTNSGWIKKYLYFESFESSGPKSSVPTYGTTGYAGKAGDIRISYQMISEGPVTVVGVLDGKSFQAFNAFDARNTQKDLTLDGEEKGMAEMGNERFFDMFSEFLFDSKMAKDALLVEERKVNVDEIFEGEIREFSNWVVILRLIALVCIIVGIFIILYPAVDFFPYLHENLKMAGGFVVMVQSLIAGFFLWMIFAGIVWFHCEPWVITCGLGSLAAVLYLSGVIFDHVWWEPLWPIQLSFTLFGEILFVLALIPLGFVVQKIHRDKEFARYIDNLNKEAGLNQGQEQVRL
jgi:hypothetical protein